MAPDFHLSPYPGRGVVVGTDADGRAFWVYFVTGRSPASRRRSLRIVGPALMVEPLDADAPPDELRHYACVQANGPYVVVGNGAHVSDIAGRLDHGESLDRVYDDLVPEPDPPIHTPRIAAVCSADGTWIGTVWRDGLVDNRVVQRVVIEPGAGFVLSTYEGDGDAVEVARTIRRVTEIASLPETVDLLWAQLDARYRVVVAGGYVDRAPAIEATVTVDARHGHADGSGGAERRARAD